MLFLDYTPELTEIDFLIYNYIKDHITEVVYMRVRDLAKETHTSTASIVRFCKKFECAGFSEFKIRLNLYLKEYENIHRSSYDIMAIENFISRARDLHYQEKIKQAVKILMDKDLVLFLGMGSSNISAEYGALYFSSIFNMALRIEDPSNHPIKHLESNFGRQIAIIALSVSGETIEIIDYLNSLNLKESAVISITNSANSTIAKLSDLNIPYYITREQLDGADITTQIPAIFTIEYLAKEVRDEIIKKMR